MTKHLRVMVGILSVALLATAASLFFIRVDTPSAVAWMPTTADNTPAASVRSIDTSLAAPARSDARRRASSLRVIVMPAETMPALEVIARLESAAKMGNVPASCRIAVDLQDCASRKSQLAAASAMEQSIQTTGATSRKLENITGGLLAASDRLEAKCAGITDKELARAFRYQLTAAKGNPELARWLVANPALDRSLFMDQLDEWKSYKEFADAYLSTALRRPSPSNLPLLLTTYKPRSYPSMDLIHRDNPAMFLALVDIAQGGGAQLPSDIAEHARAARSSPNVVEAASRQRSALEDAGWSSASLDRSDFTPGPLVKPSIEQCSQGL